MANLFNQEQDTFVCSNAKGLFNQELADLVNITFGLNVTAKQVKNYKRNHKIQSGVTGHFPKGHVPDNKGKKYPGQSNRTSFKKGQTAHNYKPVGYERVDRDGYVLIKVSDTGPWHHRWKHKHKVLWEKDNGQVPKGHVLIFSDGNKQNITLENLILVSNSQLARLNQNHLISNNPDLTKTGILIADIYNKIGKRKKKVSKK